jgi:hypothetical protein
MDDELAAMAEERRPPRVVRDRLEMARCRPWRRSAFWHRVFNSDRLFMAGLRPFIDLTANVCLQKLTGRMIPKTPLCSR